MIVRILGEGQLHVDDSAAAELNELDARLEAAVPIGDGESLERLRQRTEESATRPAGSTALVDAVIPAQGHPEDDGGESGGDPAGS